MCFAAVLRSYWAVLLFVVSDLISAFLATWLAELCREFARIHSWISGEPLNTVYFEVLKYALPYYSGLLIFLFLYFDLYEDRRLLTRSREWGRIATALGWLMLITICVDFVLPTWMAFSRLSLVLSVIFSFIFIAFGRFLIRRYREHLRSRGKDLRVAIVIGEGKTALNLCHELICKTQHGYRLACAVLDDFQGKRTEGIRVYQSHEKAREMMRLVRVDDVFLCYPNMNATDSMALLREFGQQGVCIRFVSHLFDRMVENLHILVDMVDNIPILDYRQKRRKPWRDMAKRIVDFFFAFLLVLVLSPVFLVLSFVVFFTSGWPIIFMQERLGQNQKPFKFYKFRTMKVHDDAERDALQGRNEVQGAMFKIRNDPRITPCGKWMRKFSLDELPQLFNVLKGNMSLVGPRPPLPREVQSYDIWHFYRFTAPMGISGLWQVSGRNALDFEEMILLDVYYFGNYGLLLDLRIMIRTLWVILQGTGH